MSWKIRINKRVLKDLSSLSGLNRQRIIAFLDKLVQNPIPSEYYDIKKLKGFENVYRVRFGNYRLIYAIYKKERLVKILKVASRKKAYK